MRPRLLHLGSRHGIIIPITWIWGFNEAEAFTPRIPRCVVWMVRRKRARFNEAEAFTPRIPNSPATQYHHGVASMRPRLLHLGSGAKIADEALPFAGFNEAEAFTPRIHKQPISKANLI